MGPVWMDTYVIPRKAWPAKAKHEATKYQIGFCTSYQADSRVPPTANPHRLAPAWLPLAPAKIPLLFR
jgi:hypothetical protein